MVEWRRAVLASELGLAAKVVAWGLHEHMDWDGPEAGGNCFPGLAVLELETSIDHRTMRRSIEALVDAGFLAGRCRRGCVDCRGGNGHVKVYEAHLPTPQQGAEPTAQQGARPTASSGDGAPSSGARASQQWGRPTRPIRTDQETLGDTPADKVKSCPACSGLGRVRVRTTDVNGRPLEELGPCPECTPAARSA